MRVEIVKDCSVGWAGQVRELGEGVAGLLMQRGLVRELGVPMPVVSEAAGEVADQVPDQAEQTQHTSQGETRRGSRGRR